MTERVDKLTMLKQETVVVNSSKMDRITGNKVNETSTTNRYEFILTNDREMNVMVNDKLVVLILKETAIYDSKYIEMPLADFRELLKLNLFGEVKP